MEKLKRTSTLGKGQRAKIDNSSLSELGWGKHTLEAAFVSKVSVNSFVKEEPIDFNHHCAVVIISIFNIISILSGNNIDF